MSFDCVKVWRVSVVPPFGTARTAVFLRPVTPDLVQTFFGTVLGYVPIGFVVCAWNYPGLRYRHGIEYG